MRIVAIIATNCIFAEMESSMKNNVAIKVKNVGMRFNLSQDRVDNLKEYMIRFLKRDLHFNEFWALREINFEVKKGERLGVLGLNGSGKSTLLKIVSGVLKPTTGYVQTKGKLAPLLELGAGFSQEYTGRENIYLYGAVLGYSKEFLDEKFDEIVDFSELGEFIDVPIKNYSSGMKSRLGFSIATVVEPEILILDDSASALDYATDAALRKALKEMPGDTTVFIVSQRASSLMHADTIIVLDDGRAVGMGTHDELLKSCEVYQEIYYSQFEKKAGQGE